MHTQSHAGDQGGDFPSRFDDCHARAGDRKGQHSIRVNDQFRLCFIWTPPDGPADVECVDYH